MALKKNLFGNNIDPACEYCELGQPAPDHIMVLCQKYGPVSPHHSCRRFQYDPLKRIPKLQPRLETFTADDFALD